MASSRTETNRRRQMRDKKAGAVRKKKLVRKGTTPSFPIHPAALESKQGQ